MAIFFQLYLSIPPDDYKKTTLGRGNPYRLDHQLVGAAAINSSLYKLPKNPEIQHFWLWQDPEFDPLDPQPSERLVVKRLYDFFSQEMERVQQDKRINFPDHHVVGSGLQRQLGFLHSKAHHHMIASNELLFHVILGSIPIDLSQIAVAQQPNRKHLKPAYLSPILTDLGLQPLISQKKFDQLYENFEIDDIVNHAERDVINLMKLYHNFRSL